MIAQQKKGRYQTVGTNGLKITAYFGGDDIYEIWLYVTFVTNIPFPSCRTTAVKTSVGVRAVATM